MKVLACIPDRYGSTRFPAKVLAKDTGKFIIQHTYERALFVKKVDKVIITSDSDEVLKACESLDATCAIDISSP